MPQKHPLALPAKTFLAALLAAAAGGASARTAFEIELLKRVDRLASELVSVRAQLAEVQRTQAAERDASIASAPASGPASTSASASANSATSASTNASTPVSTPASTPDTLAATPSSSPASPPAPATVLTGYGELNYNRPTRQSQNTQADVRRFVLGYQHRFDETTKVVTELEVEHAVSSASDRGEVAVEQAFIERQFTPVVSARAGLFLIPAGLLNENHEPTAYYGVERNFVETRIIPSTWREGGVQLVGSFDNGLTLQGGATTGFDLNRWDAGSTEGRDSPLGAVHQELAQAKAHDLSVFGAANWRGVPGLLVGGSVFTGRATQAQAVDTARVTLWDLHARWTPGRWDFSTLYARGTISNTAALNAALVGNPTWIPKSFDGFYAQGAYKVWSSADYALAPFVRWERLNTAKAYADLGAGITPEAGRYERVVTLGANFQVAQGVVLKADWQRFSANADLTRFDLGLGWSF